MNETMLKFCPQCGSSGYQFINHRHWYCPVCFFTYFHNVAAAAGVILELDDSILMLVRNKDPGKGLLGLPGGFVDPDECAEDAAVRECLEETGLEVEISSFVGSWPNEYTFKNVMYKTCDLYFCGKLKSSIDAIKIDASEASSFRLVRAKEILTAPIAFESARKAILHYIKKVRDKDTD